MTEAEKLKLKIGNLVFEYWSLLPEPKDTYTHYYQRVVEALENWHLAEKKEK